MAKLDKLILMLDNLVEVSLIGDVTLKGKFRAINFDQNYLILELDTHNKRAFVPLDKILYMLEV